MNREQFILEQLAEIEATTEEMKVFSHRARVEQLAVNITVNLARIRWAMRTESGHFEEPDDGQLELLEVPKFLRTTDNET